MSRIAVFEGLHRRRKARKGKSLAAYRKKGPGSHGKLKAPKGTHWRLRKTRKDAGKKGGKTPAQQTFAKAAKSCSYPKNGTSKQRRTSYNDCIRDAIERMNGRSPGKGPLTYRRKKRK